MAREVATSSNQGDVRSDKHRTAPDIAKKTSPCPRVKPSGLSIQRGARKEYKKCRKRKQEGRNESDRARKVAPFQRRDGALGKPKSARWTTPDRDENYLGRRGPRAAKGKEVTATRKLRRQGKQQGDTASFDTKNEHPRKRLAVYMGLVGGAPSIYEKKCENPHGAVPGTQAHMRQEFSRLTTMRFWPTPVGWLVLLSFMAVGTWPPRPCRAQPFPPPTPEEGGGQFELRWSLSPVGSAAIERCGSAQKLVDTIILLAGPERFVPETEAGRHIDLSILEEQDGFRARLQLYAENHETELGVRRLQVGTPDCGVLAEQLALIVAVLVETGDRSSPASASAPPPEDAPPEPPTEMWPPGPEDETPPETNQTGPSRAQQRRLARNFSPDRAAKGLRRLLGRQTRVALTVGGSLGLGLLPGPGWGLSGALRIAPQPLWPIFLRIDWWSPRQVFPELVTSAPEERASIEFSSTYATLGLCPLVKHLRPIQLSGCATLSAGVLRGQANGFRENGSKPRALMMIGIAGRGEVSLGKLAFAALQIAGQAPVLRESFLYFQAGGSLRELHRPAPVALQSILALGLRFD